jgi:hypothetical protein
MAKCRINIYYIVIYRFSFVKAAMNAAHVCKLRSGVNKTPQFMRYSMAKRWGKTIGHSALVNY